jgi:hypothetical protein
MSLLTSFSMVSEYTSNTLSEPRGWLLTVSATLLLEQVLQKLHRGFSRLVFDLPLQLQHRRSRPGDPSGVR